MDLTRHDPVARDGLAFATTIAATSGTRPEQAGLAADAEPATATVMT